MSIPASGAGPGDRFFATIIEKAIEFYLRHKAEIDNNLTSLMVEALMTLAGGLGPGGEITVMNDPGPE
jgi:hypothetical protein